MENFNLIMRFPDNNCSEIYIIFKWKNYQCKLYDGVLCIEKSLIENKCGLSYIDDCFCRSLGTRKRDVIPYVLDKLNLVYSNEEYISDTEFYEIVYKYITGDCTINE